MLNEQWFVISKNQGEEEDNVKEFSLENIEIKQGFTLKNTTNYNLKLILSPEPKAQYINFTHVEGRNEFSIPLTSYLKILNIYC
jgi:hypothetical protein